MFLSSTKNQLSFLLKAGKTTKKPNNKASTITVADLNVGETTVWLTISNTKYDNCISEDSMVVVNQTLNPKVKAEVLTTANSSVVLVADEPPANATKHFWQIVESAPDALSKMQAVKKPWRTISVRVSTNLSGCCKTMIVPMPWT